MRLQLGNQIAGIAAVGGVALVEVLASAAKDNIKGRAADEAPVRILTGNVKGEGARKSVRAFTSWGGVGYVRGRDNPGFVAIKSAQVSQRVSTRGLLSAYCFVP